MVILHNLIVLRALEALTQAQLADASGVPRQTLSLYERGLPCHDLAHADAIARALGVSSLMLTDPITIVDGKVRLAREELHA